jgi:hypothetical protein
MDFFIKNLQETLKAIEIIIGKAQINGGITVRKIKKILGIKSSNKSKTNFIWRALNYLEEKELIILINTKPSKMFTVKNLQLFDVDEILSQAIKERIEN